MRKKIEILAPAKNLFQGMAAINAGADAVYIGAPQFGARSNATNSLEDIAEMVKYAHLFKAQVFVVINTILYDNELDLCRKLIYQLYDIGVDALIIQDMAIMEMDLPPIVIHASTQANNRDAKHVKFLKDAGMKTKSGIMLGLGETEQEIYETMDDLRAAGCDVLTMGQYLQPTKQHLPVVEFIHPEVFAKYKVMGLEKGFRYVESGPMIRSSYHAEKHIF